MVAPFNVLRHHKVLMTLHGRLAALVSEGVLVVADINPGSRLSPVGQSGGSRQGQGGKCDGEDGVHLS